MEDQKLKNSYKSADRPEFKEIEHQLEINTKLQRQLTEQSEVNEQLNSSLFQK